MCGRWFGGAILHFLCSLCSPLAKRAQAEEADEAEASRHRGKAIEVDASDALCALALARAR